MKRFLVFAMMVSVAFAGDEPGERVVWNGLQPGVKWDTADGISVTVQGDVLSIRCNAEYGWATTEVLLPVTDTTKVELEARGKLNGQIEWFREDGTFLSATKVEASLKAGKISELLPAGEPPKKFRFKFWVEGQGTETKLSKALVTATLAWRKTGTKLVATYDEKSKATADAGMKLDGLAMKLDTEYSAFVFEEKVAYNPKATLLVDVAAIKDGALTVQALCWNEAGEFLKAVDLVKDMTLAGYTEVPVAMHKEEFPAGVAKLSFKVWLSGREATARLAALRYGVQP